jgi:hypothetical protein
MACMHMFFERDICDTNDKQVSAGLLSAGINSTVCQVESAPRGVVDLAQNAGRDI